jgi:hypothetical protein
MMESLLSTRSLTNVGGAAVRFSLLAIALSVALMPSPLLAATVTAERSEGGAVVKIDGQPFTEYLTLSGNKPILWPIIGPTGKPLTRDYPMAKEADETKDHVHHRSLWFTHGSVNGVDFWAEKPGAGGIIERHREFVRIESGPRAVIVTRNDWLGPDGKKQLEDERTLTFGVEGQTRWIDYAITLKATEGPVKFADTKEGTFGVRVAETMRVDAKKGGRIVNSKGQVNGDAWGKPAEWVDYHGPVDGQTVGIAILNHPGSFRFPTYWHVRTYGLFAANPFGVRDFAGKTAADGSHTIPGGEALTLRYRVVLHRGDEKEGKIAEMFSAYSRESR